MVSLILWIMGGSAVLLGFVLFILWWANRFIERSDGEGDSNADDVPEAKDQ